MCAGNDQTVFRCWTYCMIDLDKAGTAGFTGPLQKKPDFLSRRIRVLYMASKEAVRDLCRDLDARLVPGRSPHRD